MKNIHTNIVRELAKFFSGMVAADIIMGLWIVSGSSYKSLFLGIPLNEPFVGTWLVVDCILLFFLIHYGWQIRLPASSSRKALYVIVGIILAIVAIAHLLRIMYAVPLVIGSFTLPFWPSIVGTLIAAFLSYASFHFAAKKSNSSNL
jgi:hypothetical protein